jgi:hypothetical protein
MIRRDLHRHYDFFEYLRLDDGSVPPPAREKVDVALLDMNHSWPNVGHDSLAHAVLEAAEEVREMLLQRGRKLRLISFDVRRRLQIPESPNGRFQLYIGTGGPGHLDPRLNDGKRSWSQGISESAEWEAPLFHLFEDIVTSESAALIAVCHSFGLLCRWSGVAHAELREQKSSGMPMNALAPEAVEHPWFSQFADRLPDHRHFRVIDNRLFDLVLDQPGKACPLAFEAASSQALTMLELDRERSSGMPRVFGVNHHPEIIDREHIMSVLEEKRDHGEVEEGWYRERAGTLSKMLQGETERQSRLTSYYTLLGPLRHHLTRVILSREDGEGPPPSPHLR